MNKKIRIFMILFVLFSMSTQAIALTPVIGDDEPSIGAPKWDYYVQNNMNFWDRLLMAVSGTVQTVVGGNLCTTSASLSGEFTGDSQKSFGTGAWHNAMVVQMWDLGVSGTGWTKIDISSFGNLQPSGAGQDYRDMWLNGQNQLTTVTGLLLSHTYYWQLFWCDDQDCFCTDYVSQECRIQNGEGQVLRVRECDNVPACDGYVEEFWDDWWDFEVCGQIPTTPEPTPITCSVPSNPVSDEWCAETFGYGQECFDMMDWLDCQTNFCSNNPSAATCTSEWIVGEFVNIESPQVNVKKDSPFIISGDFIPSYTGSNIPSTYLIEVGPVECPGGCAGNVFSFMQVTATESVCDGNKHFAGKMITPSGVETVKFDFCVEAGSVLGDYVYKVQIFSGCGLDAILSSQEIIVTVADDSTYPELKCEGGLIEFPDGTFSEKKCYFNTDCDVGEKCEGSITFAGIKIKSGTCKEEDDENGNGDGDGVLKQKAIDPNTVLDMTLVDREDSVCRSNSDCDNENCKPLIWFVNNKYLSEDEAKIIVQDNDFLDFIGDFWELGPINIWFKTWNDELFETGFCVIKEPPKPTLSYFEWIQETFSVDESTAQIIGIGVPIFLLFLIFFMGRR